MKINNKQKILTFFAGFTLGTLLSPFGVIIIRIIAIFLQ